MDKLFTIMIMWVLVYNGLCPMGLALGYTIGISACIIITAIANTVKEKQKKNKTFYLNYLTNKIKCDIILM